MTRKTKFIGFRADTSLYNFLMMMTKKIRIDTNNPKENMSALIVAVLKRFWLEWMLGMTKTPTKALEKEFKRLYEKTLKTKSYKKAKTKR
jgi:predicted phage-related endonuclease